MQWTCKEQLCLQWLQECSLQSMYIPLLSCSYSSESNHSHRFWSAATIYIVCYLCTLIPVFSIFKFSIPPAVRPSPNNNRYSLKHLIEWLIDFLIDWLIDWLNDWLIDLLIDLIDWLHLPVKVVCFFPHPKMFG